MKTEAIRTIAICSAWAVIICAMAGCQAISVYAGHKERLAAMECEQ